MELRLTDEEYRALRRAGSAICEDASLLAGAYAEDADTIVVHGTPEKLAKLADASAVDANQTASPKVRRLMDRVCSKATAASRGGLAAAGGTRAIGLVARVAAIFPPGGSTAAGGPPFEELLLDVQAFGREDPVGCIPVIEKLLLACGLHDGPLLRARAPLIVDIGLEVARKAARCRRVFVPLIAAFETTGVFTGTEASLARAPMGQTDRAFVLGEIERRRRRAEHLAASRLAALAAAFSRAS